MKYIKQKLLKNSIWLSCCHVSFPPKLPCPCSNLFGKFIWLLKTLTLTAFWHNPNLDKVTKAKKENISDSGCKRGRGATLVIATFFKSDND